MHTIFVRWVDFSPLCFFSASYDELSAVNSGIVKAHGKEGRGARRSPGPSATNNRHSGYEPSALGLREEVERLQNEVSCARTPSQKAQRQGGMKETQEQAIAMARGGVRYGRVVFHRKGVKLTQDSPRSMLPRDVRDNKCLMFSSQPRLTLPWTLSCKMSINATEGGCLAHRIRAMWWESHEAALRCVARTVRKITTTKL